MSDNNDLLILTDVTKRFAETTILDHLSLSVTAGETVAIVGPSGSGKSTLLNLIGALDMPTSGSIRLGDVEVTTLSGNALSTYRATKIGFVFQEHHLLPQLTALENVMLPTLLAYRSDVADEALSLLERVGVGEHAGAFPAQLSGGERQRVAIARALINHPAVLLCDEPTGNLDGVAGGAVITLLLDLAAREQVTILLVTHNPAHASRCARTMELAQGNLIPFSSRAEAAS